MLSIFAGVESLAATPNSRSFIECRMNSRVNCNWGENFPVCSVSPNTALQVGGGKTQAAIDYAKNKIGYDFNPYI